MRISSCPASRAIGFEAQHALYAVMRELASAK